MVAAADRKLARIRVALPSGKHVDIPVIQKASFVVAADQYQGHDVYFRNDANTDRQVRVQAVRSVESSSQTINVERIKKFQAKTIAEQAQDRDYIVKNEDPPPIQLNGDLFPAHEKVHYVRFYADGDTDQDAWVDVELIDKLKIICPNEQYQEWQVYCRHDEPGDFIADSRVPYPVSEGTCPPDLDLLTGDGINPPYRLDPFQNIVTFNDDELNEPFSQWYGSFLVDAGSPFSHVWGDLSAQGFNYPEFLQHLADGSAYIAGHIDMRLVDQVYTPHTYVEATGGDATGTIHGYTQQEFVDGPGTYWLDQWHANPGPATLEYYYPELIAYSDAWWQRFIDSGNISGNPRPFVTVRWVALGPITTDVPNGRY